MNMKRVLLIILLMIILASLSTGVFARSGSGGDNQTSVLKPGQSLVVLCDGGEMPSVFYLRVGGVRVMCPEVAQ